MSKSTETTQGVEKPSPRRELRPLKLRHLVGVALVTALFMGPISAFASHQFPDVPDSNLFHDQIDWMSDTGITTGFPDGTFKPNNNVTRGAPPLGLLAAPGHALAARGRSRPPSTSEWGKAARAPSPRPPRATG